MPTPLPLPPDYNPATHMLVHTVETGSYHESRKAARFAGELVANGAAEDLALAENVLDAVLACQETNPADPHCGNFYWMAEDSHVEDLNAVEFCLEALIPMMLTHRERLSEPLQERVRGAIRLGLDEIRRLDVLVAYSNITALDVLNTCLGGELLGDAVIAQRGYAKLRAWIAFTCRSGHPMEYNSPTYTAVTLRALHRLASLVRDDDTRIRARAFVARLALSAALHIHPGTGRWAAPHSRAYHPSVVGATPPEMERVQGWLADGTIPAWIDDVLRGRPARYTITETAERSRGIGFTTHVTPAWALGVASTATHNQSDVCMLHYTRPSADKETEKPGVLYTRYVFNDKWFGDFYHATDRSQQRNLLDEGAFYGVMEGNRAIGVYAAQSFVQGSSAKATFIWTGCGAPEEVWIDGERVTDLPADVPPGATVVVGSGAVYTAIRPLTRTPLGKETPARLLAREGDLVLELYNYRGPEKRFWEQRWPGAFFQGYPICAYYLEVAERSDYANGVEMTAALAGGEFSESLDAPYTFPAEGERRYSAAYSRDGKTLGVEVDLMGWRLLKRWDTNGDVGWPMLEAEEQHNAKAQSGKDAEESVASNPPESVQSLRQAQDGAASSAFHFARQSNDGQVAAAGGVAECTAPGLWLWGDESTGKWVAGHFGEEPATLKLTTPEGSVIVSEMGTGVVYWEKGAATVEAIGLAQVEQL